MSETDDGDLGQDGDEFSEGEGESVFPVQYRQAGSVAAGLDQSALVQLQHCGTDQLAGLTDVGGVTVWSLPGLARLCELGEGVRGLAGNGEPGRLITCSQDQVEVWDTREPGKSVLRCRDTSKHGKPRPYSCCGAGAWLLAAGTEQVVGEAAILFWDLRSSGKLLGGYWETHSDDLTSLQFSPDSPGLLATGGTDGLVNVLDTSQPSEDEALVASLNTESSVGRAVWWGERLAVQTHTECLQLWDTREESGQQSTELDRAAVCHGIRRTNSHHTYIAG